MSPVAAAKPLRNAAPSPRFTGVVNNPINYLRKALLEHNPRSVLRAIIYYNDLSALKQRLANRVHDPFDRALSL